MFSKIDKNAIRKARHHRQRRHIIGTPERPRLNVYRSTCHIYAQVINDEVGNTLVAASTLDAELKGQLEGKNKVEQAKLALERTDRSVTDIAYDLGWSSGNYFCTVFKKLTGVSPLQYRKQSRE